MASILCTEMTSLCDANFYYFIFISQFILDSPHTNVIRNKEDFPKFASIKTIRHQNTRPRLTLYNTHHGGSLNAVPPLQPAVADHQADHQVIFASDWSAFV